MGYSKTNWQNLPNEGTPLSANNLNKIENELEKLDPGASISYTSVTGTYTTAEWSEGTKTNCTWTAPASGLYLIFASFRMSDDDKNKAKVYKQFQLRGSATRVVNNLLFYQAGTDSSTDTASANQALMGGTFCTLVSATTNQDIYPYIHTAQAGIVWDVKIVGVFLR